MTETTRGFLVLVLAAVQTCVLAWIAAWQRRQIARAEGRAETLLAEVASLRAPLKQVQETLRGTSAKPERVPPSTP